MDADIRAYETALRRRGIEVVALAPADATYLLVVLREELDLVQKAISFLRERDGQDRPQLRVREGRLLDALAILEKRR